jgi:hypothetical protein
VTAKRPKALKWIGPMLPDGRPERYLDDVPPRDLSEDETDALTHEQLAIIRQHHDLYKEVHAPEPKKKSATTKVAEPESSSNSAGSTITGTVGNTSSPAAEPATESEG